MPPPVVETACGRLEGLAKGGVDVFLGVPYAQPPVGPLRFLRPRPPVPWSGVRSALRFGPAAPQLAGARAVALASKAVGAGISEDCLYLNVWSPRDTAGRRPVMVWLHGGGFFLGAGSRFLYSGRELARRGDVVVVTLNYRLGALGFLDLTSLADSPGDGAQLPSNLGLYDQIAALEWVQENIAAFGGDPGNVTVFGESAGAMSVGTLLGLGTGLFRRAILESGAAANFTYRNDAAEIAEFFLRGAGLDKPDVTALQDMPLKRILSAQRYVFAQAARRRIDRLPWQPSLDGRLLSQPPLESIAQGKARGVELLIGTNRDEWRLFTAGALQSRWMRDTGLRHRLTRLLALAGLEHTTPEELVSAYRSSSSARTTTPYDVWAAVRTDQYFRMPAIELAERQARHAPTFMYRFDFPIPLMPRSLGACHATEVPLVFGSFRHPALKPISLESRDAARLAVLLQEVWSTFAREGVARAETLEPWPLYETTTRATMILDRQSHAVVAPDDELRRLWLEPR